MPRILLTGATGYGGRLLKYLVNAGCPVRCLAGIVSIMILMVAMSSLAWADFDFRPSYIIDGKTLQLYSRADFKILGLFHVFSAGLYLEEQTVGRDALTDVPKRLELVYARSIEADSFGKQADKTLKKILTSDEWKQLGPRIDLLHTRYRTVRAGDRYVLTYIPNEGTELTLNGKPVVTIPGADFARAYYAIWLGAQSGFPKFTQRLLTELPNP